MIGVGAVGVGAAATEVELGAGVEAGSANASCFDSPSRLGTGIRSGAISVKSLSKNRNPIVWITGNAIEAQAHSLQRPVTKQSAL